MVIGGLLSSTLLTLFLVPVVYELIGSWQERRVEKRAEGVSKAESPPARDEESTGATSA
jgi:HAE1 family hydrophobic/amphiphilic exporter-1